MRLEDYIRRNLWGDPVEWRKKGEVARGEMVVANNHILQQRVLDDQYAANYTL